MNKWAADPAENQPRNTIFRQDFNDFRDLLNDNKGVGRWAVWEEEEKNEYLALQQSAPFN